MRSPGVMRAVVAAAVLLASGCSGGDGPGWVASAIPGLLGALGKATATDTNRTYVEYGDLAQVRALTDRDEDRFQGISGYGYGVLAPMTVVISEELGFDPRAMDEALTVGRPPDWAGVFWGDYDVAELDQELEGRDIPSEKSGDGTRWTSADDREINFEGPLAGIARTSELNNIRTADGSLAYAPTRAGLGWVTDPGADTLADDESLRALAGCLGGVTVAVLSRPEGDVTAYAAGVRAPSADDVTDVACLAPDGDADALRDHVERELRDGTTPSSRQPWSELLPAAEVDVVDGVVRIEATPGADSPVGMVMRMLVTNDLAALAG
ncbi:MAG: hypothetical protein GEV28_06485 [Actinophytocola sp.]|uniref:hypothetical protein n=1 Tax=Actinophytocola sp. TaxID=1872138 RepID=UPI0013213F52|nr:hypothetical protein [Actinophytocola sp.]MPZ80044.1 hypothetical protein [Actinophytocola sp.]